MKNMKMMNLVMMVTLGLSSLTTFAQEGGINGGGGDVVKTKSQSGRTLLDLAEHRWKPIILTLGLY